MLALMSTQVVLKMMSASIPTYAAGPRWRVWTEKKATAALRAVVGHQGLNPEDYALHSGRIGVGHD